MKQSKIFVGIVSLIVILSSFGIVLLAGVSDAADTNPSGGTLKVGWMQEQDTLNPFLTITVQGRLMSRMIYSYLVELNETLVPEPMLAKSWTVSADGLTWTYSLAENAKWSDGTPLKASDVKFTLEFIKSRNISAFLSLVSSISSIATNGDYGVTVVYKSPVASVLGDMCQIPIVPEHIWDNFTTKDEVLAFPNSNPVGSGAFKFVSWEKATSVVLDANKDYWGTAPHIDRVVFQFYANAETLVNALRSGQIDLIGKELPPSSVAVLSKDTQIRVSLNTDLYFRHITINCGQNGGPNSGNPTLWDVNVRRALSMAVDKQYLVDNIQFGTVEAGSTIVQKAASYWWNPNVVQFKFDIAAANKLLNDSGYLDIDNDGIRESPNGTVEMSYTLWVINRWPEEMRTGQMLQEWWSKLGVKLDVVSADANTILSKIWKMDMYLWGFSGQPDPSMSLMIPLTSLMGTYNGAGYSNATYDALWIQQSHETNMSKRRDIVFQMQDIIYQDAPYIVLYYTSAIGAYRTDTFTGFVNMPTGVLSFVNTHTLMNVHLLSEKTTPSAKTDYTPWIVAAAAAVVAIVAISYAFTRKGQGGKKGSD
jgi:peptide/nickel transport system substrate-binding protein